MYGSQAAFLSAGGYHHHIGLNTWHSKNREPAPKHAPGLYHTAFLYPERKDLARILKRIVESGYPITGASDHGVSEALRSEEHTSELQSRGHLVCRLLLEKKN